MTYAQIDIRARSSREPYGPASSAHYADPGYQSDKKKRYPLDSEAHCRAAWSYVNQEDNAAKYSPEQLARIKAKIKAAGKRYGITFAPDNRSAFPDYIAVEARRAFLEDNYKRDPKGSATGGQFTSKPAETTKRPDPKPKPPARREPQPKQSMGSGVMAYDPSADRGPGYGTRDGDARVKRLQDALNRLGVRDSRGRKLAVDGKLGPLTTQAVKAAQRRLGLTADGKVDAKLLNQLAEAKSLPDKKKPKRCTCRSVECVNDECRDDDGGEVRRVDPVATRAFDLDAKPSGDGRTLEGYVAVFGQVARINDRNGDFDEEIHRGAFDRSLKRGFPVMQFEHGKDPRVGSLPIGVYDVFEPDQRGYFVRGRLLDDPVVDPIRKAIAAGAIRGMSWRMVVPDTGQKWSRRSRFERGVDKRDVIDADVPEAGPVVFPTYSATTVAVRSVLDGLDVDELRSLRGELSARLGLDLPDLTAESHAWSAADGDHGTRPGGQLPTPSHLLARDRALRARGVLT